MNHDPPQKPKKNGFIIEQITEDSFYENLLMGLTSTLKSCSFVSQIALERYPPASWNEVFSWETANDLVLPEDLRDFYLSSDGFSLTYKFQYDKNTDEGLNFVRAGLEINPLDKLERLAPTGNMYWAEGGFQLPRPYSKIYVLSKCDDDSVVLAQFSSNQAPSIWLYYRRKNFYYLCEDLVTYLRMALAHLCVPGWQMAALKASLPEWSGEMLQILAPGVADRPSLETKSDVNVIDEGIFQT